jgi:ribosomal protein L12E/L44/L45/RPP1/RPP2
MTAILEETPVEEMNLSCITFLNKTGDVTITFDAQNAEVIKELVRKKMAQGYSFFTMRKLLIDSIQVKRKIKPKNVDSITSVIIDDATFEKLVNDLDDKDVAEVLLAGSAQMVKLKGKKVFDAIKVAKTPEEVVESEGTLAFRKVVGG